MGRRPQKSGTIYLNKAKKRWVAQIDLGVDSTGNRIRRSATAATKKEAQTALRKLEAKYLTPQGANPAAVPSSELVSSYLERWFSARQPAWAPRTVELYHHQIDNHIVPRIGHLRLDALKPLDIQEMMDDIVIAGALPTANKCRRLLLTALKQAVRWEIIPKNPVESVDPLPERHKERTLWTLEQASRFIESSRDHPLFAAFFLLLTTGLRRGELLGLRWSDVDSAGIRVNQTISVVHNRPTIGIPKTRRSQRYVALAPDALQVLEEHRARQARAKKVIGPSFPHPELVFPSETGTLMHPRNFYRTWSQAVEAAGVPKARIHDMRHLHITLLIQCGEDPKVIADRAGHSSTSFTLDRYGQVFQAHRMSAARSLPQLLAHDHHHTNVLRVDRAASDSRTEDEPDV